MGLVLKIFRSALLVITAVTRALSLFGGFFGKRKEELSASAEETENVWDNLSFAKGEPVFKAGDISVSAKSAVLCTDSGILLYEKQADVPLPMASITKVMTAITVLDTLGVKDTADAEALKKEVNVEKASVGIEGSSVYLKENERVTLEMLLYSLMLESANDAASAIAVAVGGSEESFVAAMNEKARSLRMESTVFKNSHGLSDEGHYTTARDYARLMAYAIDNPVFCQIISTRKAVFPSADGEMTRVLTNHNRLLTTYKDMIGGKTGYTKVSGRTLVTAAERNGTRLICVTINAPDDWNDHVSLFENGFSAVKTEIMGEDRIYTDVPVACGDAETVRCAVKKSVRVSTLNGAEITVKYFCRTMLLAPIKLGDEIGRAEIYVSGEKVIECRLYAVSEVKCVTETEKTPLFKRITAWLKG